jgi:hypothetical protein
MERAPLREVVNLVAFATRPRFVLEGDPLGRSRRLCVSSGALHPIDCVLFDPRGSLHVMRYDPCGHCVQLLVVKDRGALKRLDANCREILPEARGMVMALVGDLSRVKSVYDNPWSLLWRDAGALLQTLALCAAAYRLAFCPLGALGAEMLGALDLGGRNIVPAGIAMIGRPAGKAQPAE